MQFFKLLFIIGNGFLIVTSLIAYFTHKDYFDDLFQKSLEETKVSKIDTVYLHDTITLIKTYKSSTTGTSFNLDFFTAVHIPMWIYIVLAIIVGLIGFLTPCVYPLVVLTSSLFENHSSSAGRRRFNGFVYFFTIACTYACFSIPFLLLGNIDPNSYNLLFSQSWVNLVFFITGTTFAISLLGGFEVNLPSRLAWATDKRSNINSVTGVAFRALTQVIISFSCIAPLISFLIIIVLPVGVKFLLITLSVFGVSIALPVTLPIIFPGLRYVLPKSGKWLTTIKNIIASALILLCLWQLWLMIF